MEWWIEEEIRGLEARARPPRRRAMVGLALPVVAGAATGICAAVPPMWFWGAGALLLLPLFVWVRRKWAILPLILALFFLMAAHARQSTSARPETSLPAMLVRPMEYVQFVAMALEDGSPQPARPGRAAGTVFYAQVEGLNRDGVWRRVDDRIRVVLRGDMSGKRVPRYGERWRLHGIVRPAVPRRAGLFTLPENQAVVDADRVFFLDGGRGNPVKAWCLARRRACREILGRGLEDFPEQRGLVQSLMMGYREDLPAALRKDFSATGTVHIFAISGSHVAMVTLLIAGILRTLGLPLTRWVLFMAPLIVVYTITTGAAVSAVRSCVMAVLMLMAPILHRRPDAISTLAAAAVVILLAAPAQLGDLGFLLSFTAVAGLLALPPVLDAWAVRRFRREEWQLPGEEPPRGRRLREAALAGIRYFNVTLGAWIATTPLTAFFFNLFSPVALAMNLLVIPAAFLILLAGVLSLICAPLGGSLTEIFNHAAWAVSTFLTACIQWAAGIPGGHWFVRTPPAAGVIAWYGLLVAVAILARRIRGVLMFGLGGLAVLAAAWGIWEAHRCRVSVLDVGEGNAVLVQARTARMLVDAGPGYRGEDLLRMLRGEGVNHLDALILTHPDAQHMGAAVWLLDQLPVRELQVPSVMWTSPLMRAVLNRAEQAGMPVRRLRAGDAGDWPGGMAWEVLWPPDPVKTARADDAALVMRVARYGAAILLAGDAGAPQEKTLQENGRSLAAAILLVGQHGDREATSSGWLEAVRPREAILSCGPHSDGRHPDEEILARLAARGIRVWRTDQLGSIHVDLDGAPARWPDPGYRIWARP